MTSAPPLPHLKSFRQQFPALGNKAYFNYGGQGPMPQAAIAAILQAHETVQRVGPFNGEVNSWLVQEGHQTRGAIASELQVPVETITLTENVSVGCNIPLWGITWHPGDHILMTDCEHPSVIATVQELQHRFGIEVSTCPVRDTLNEGDPVAVIAQHLRPTTRLVIVSHILWNTGQVLPLEEIIAVCHRQASPSGPIRVLVDAAQSVGVLPLSLTASGVDFYAFTGHKWWCGPAGVGGLYVSPEALTSLRPTFIGWKGITKDSSGYPTGWEPDGKRFEVATSDYTLYSGLREAIAIHHQWGTAAARYERIQSLSGYLWKRLSALPQITCLRTAPPAAGLVSFTVSGFDDGRAGSKIHSRFVQALERKGFMVRTILDPDCVRACVHYFTAESEIDQLIEAIQQLEF